MSHLLLRFIFLSLALSFVGCASKIKDYDYMASDEYQEKPLLRQSVVSASAPLSEKDVQKILSSRVTLPKRVNLAIVRLSESNADLDFQVIDQEIADKFYDKTNWGPRIQSIIPVPQMMISKPVNLTSLRQAAVLLQADALLIIKPVSYSDWKFQWLADNKGKGITSLEVLLLDTRTNVVPYTSVITEAVELAKSKDDYSNNELMSRAKKASETKALLQIAPDVQKFMSKTMR